MLTTDDRCPRCRDKTSSDWSGYLLIINPGKSEIASRAGITIRGKYALKVR